MQCTRALHSKPASVRNDHSDSGCSHTLFDLPVGASGLKGPARHLPTLTPCGKNGDPDLAWEGRLTSTHRACVAGPRDSESDSETRLAGA